ncbi:hypothetical protein [Streptomyces sp. COG19]|uniref:hypothetical protein n=1 Tax=Streptomyces sp. COG19 TaxID=2838870 RepID=UPI002036824E|nr:hypothetical protein [Streptomyces sp. COG19]
MRSSTGAGRSCGGCAVPAPRPWIAHGGAAHVDQTAHILALVLAALVLAAG